MITKKSVKVKFTEQLGLYKRLGSNLEQAIQSFLEIEKISHLSVSHRIKEFDSFYDKIDRKKYTKPFEEIEDTCGVRIICYYASDIEKIERIIKKEFEVLETQNKSEILGLKEFAYRSFHYIVKIKKTWTETPNYRGLEILKTEIQVRTILMHAWAEIEHKLNYKNDLQVPVKFQRKLFRLSAKFEEADEQFEELKDGIASYREDITEKAITDNKFDTHQEFNLDSLIAFYQFHFPNHEIDQSYLNMDFDLYIRNKINFSDMENALVKGKPYIAEISQDLSNSGYTNNLSEMPTEFVGFLMAVFDKIDYSKTIPSWKSNVNNWKKKLSK